MVVASVDLIATALSARLIARIYGFLAHSLELRPPKLGQLQSSVNAGSCTVGRVIAHEATGRTQAAVSGLVCFARRPPPEKIACSVS